MERLEAGVEFDRVMERWGERQGVMARGRFCLCSSPRCPVETRTTAGNQETARSPRTGTR
jgi:hypothetical protein